LSLARLAQPTHFRSAPAMSAWRQIVSRGLTASAAQLMFADAVATDETNGNGSLTAARGPPAPVGGRPRVLVVGAGLTGCLTAHFLRRQRPDVEIHVWERATYPAGRFGAATRHGGVVSDLGAQVLSTVSPNDERARPGHGITRASAVAADELVMSLLTDGLLVPAPDGALCETEVRDHFSLLELILLLS